MKKLFFFALVVASCHRPDWEQRVDFGVSKFCCQSQNSMLKLAGLSLVSDTLLQISFCEEKNISVSIALSKRKGSTKEYSPILDINSLEGVTIASPVEVIANNQSKSFSGYFSGVTKFDNGDYILFLRKAETCGQLYFTVSNNVIKTKKTICVEKCQ